MRAISSTICGVMALVSVCCTAGNAAAAQGTITAVFRNNVAHSTPIGVWAIADVGWWDQFNLGTGSKYGEYKRVWIKSGQTITKTINYDMSFFGQKDLELNSISVLAHFNGGSEMSASKQIGWPMNGTTCYFTYTGNVHNPVQQVSCTK